MQGRRISAYLQYLMTCSGVEDVYQESEAFFKRYLRLDVSASQTYRVTLASGTSLQEEELYEGQSYQDSDWVYAMIDGSFILTREGYKEVKVGRVFSERSVCLQSHTAHQERVRLSASEYCAHQGSHQAFKPKMESLLSKIDPHKLVFISDGCPWIGQWISEKYPQATQILDYYHAVEKLTVGTKNILKSANWIEQQQEYLLAGQVSQVIENIKQLKRLPESEKEQLIIYYQNNSYRMNYDQYKANGYYIGSGAIEAAHRTLIQERMKRSGQRWGKYAETLLKLRVAFKSKKDHLIENLFRKVA